MEGLIPYVYKAIVQYRNGGGAPPPLGGGAWFNESPSASYIRLPGDSDRFCTSEMNKYFSSLSPPSPVAAVSSALYRPTSRLQA